MKLACVVQRYGRELSGGSEAHCRQFAERLAARHEITVLTSCAHDYLSWRNVYPAGEAREGPLRVIRFRARRRRMRRFWAACDAAYSGYATLDEERRWFHENGPVVPGLVEHLARHGGDYDAVLFWTFRHYPSFFGLPEVADRAILLPTAEEDPVIRFRVLRELFTLPRGLLFLTPEEAKLVERVAAVPLPPSEIIGTGLEPPPAPDPAPLEALGLESPFLLYLGRVDPNKGCRTLLDNYLDWVDRAPRPAPLVLAGEAAMEVPEHPMIRPLGFVDDAVREALLAGARVLITPSRYESLCLALLEGWNHGRPALVNGWCAVLRGQVRRANGGLYYQHADEFAAALDLLLERPELADTLGRQGRDYVDRRYRWPVVLDRLERFLERLRILPAAAGGGASGAEVDAPPEGAHDVDASAG